MIKILKFLKIIQEVDNEERHNKGLKRLGKGCFTARRLNIFNPLSYVVLLVGVFLVILSEIYDTFTKMDNPFKWN